MSRKNPPVSQSSAQVLVLEDIAGVYICGFSFGDAHEAKRFASWIKRSIKSDHLDLDLDNDPRYLFVYGDLQTIKQISDLVARLPRAKRNFIVAYQEKAIVFYLYASNGVIGDKLLAKFAKEFDSENLDVGEPQNPEDLCLLTLRVPKTMANELLAFVRSFANDERLRFLIDKDLVESGTLSFPQTTPPASPFDLENFESNTTN